MSARILAGVVGIALTMSALPAAAQAAAPPVVTQPATPPAGLTAMQAGTAYAFAGLSLVDAEKSALANSPDVSAANAVVNENSAALAAVRSALGPQLVGGFVTAPQASPTGGTITSKITSVGVQTTIGDIAAYSPLVAAAVANLRNAQSAQQSAMRMERVKLVGLYYDALKTRAVHSARESALATASEQLRAAELRFKAGDAPKLDVIRANVAVAKTTADAELARVADVNATEALRTETGAPETAFATTTTAPPPLDTLAIDPQVAVTRARLLRPELAAAQQVTAAAQASARVARRATLPALTVGAGYATGIDGGQHVASPTVNVTLNLPLSGAAHARVSQADAIVAEDQAKAAATARAIDIEVAATARNLAATKRATAATTEARRQAEAQLAATQLGYRNGASSSLELSSARDVYTQALVDELSALYDEARARAILALEVGQ